MSRVQLNCPSCGHRIAYEGGDDYVTCPKCGRSNRVKRS